MIRNRHNRSILIGMAVIAFIVSIILLTYKQYITPVPTIGNPVVAYNKNGEITPAEKIPMRDPVLYVCGSFNSDSKEMLAYILLRSSDQVKVGSEMFGALTPPGEFCTRIWYDGVLIPGDYIISIYYYRILLTTLKFELTGN